MKNNVYYETVLDFEKKRTYKEIKQNQIQNKIYSLFPRIEQINNELKSIGIKMAKELSYDKSRVDLVLNKYESKSNHLKNEQYEILANAGYPRNYLEMVYDCKLCKDTGFINNAPCKCFTAQLINKYYKQSNLNNILDEENFDTFNLDYYDEQSDKFGVSPKLNMQNIFLKTINYVNDFSKENINLYLYGNPGLGKTFLSHCIAKDLLDKGITVIYQTASDLIDTIRKSKFNNNDKDIINFLYECELLIIDDLGTENSTDFSNNELFNLINKRLIMKKKIIISTNLSLKQLQNRYSSRLTSRIIGNFLFLKFVGDDIRLKKANLL
ncbi:MAG: ATP-binding protein [Eubacteriaceae bacterium]